MSANPKPFVNENPLEQNSGDVWHRLHSEREDICEALLQEPSLASAMLSDCNTTWHHDLLQSRLSKVDQALDRLLAGSYGNCARCGRWIEDTKLEFDPAIAFCLACWDRVKTH